MNRLRAGTAALEAEDALCGRCRVHSQIVAGPEKPVVSNKLLWRVDEQRLMHEDTLGRIAGLNGRYVFGLRYNSQKSLWTLVALRSNDLSAAFRQLISGQDAQFNRLTTLADGSTLGDVIARGQFTVKKVLRETDEAIDIEFTNSRNGSQVGTATLLPEQHYAIQNYTTSFKVDNIPQRYEMRRSVGTIAGHIACTAIRLKYFDPASGAVTQTDEYLYSEHSFDSPDPAIFTLSHYGLPEPGSPATPKRLPWPLLLALAAAVAAGVVAWAVRRHRRLSV